MPSNDRNSISLEGEGDGSKPNPRAESRVTLTPRILRTQSSDEEFNAITSDVEDLDSDHLELTNDVSNDAENWLADPKLQELASQLNSDANFLARCYPSNQTSPASKTRTNAESVNLFDSLCGEDDEFVPLENHKSDACSHDEAVWLNRKTITPAESRGIGSGRYKLARHLATSTAIASVLIAIATIAYPMLTSNRPDSSKTAGNNSHASDADRRSELLESGAINFPIDQLADSKVHVPEIGRDEDVEITHLQDERTILSTEVSSRASSLIYYASQAELEGLIDAVDRSPSNKIRIGF